ncbi:MAG: hypothetical protein DHS20C12_04510 [Pseudohongiella sp.]|nr:MAG: hypothetical protein DHS20C12_04510 [Pseudohongiella sp.]
MIQLHRFTTEYIEIEDRIRIGGESDENEKIVLWLTQRLLLQIVSHLLGLIEKKSSSASKKPASQSPASNLLQSFEQQAAQASLSPELPVETSVATQNWLVQEVDIALNPEGALIFIFKRVVGDAAELEDTDKATLSVEAKQLRQWLGILHAIWQKAGWPLGIWPSWMDELSPADTDNALH